MGAACSTYGGKERRIQGFGEGKRPMGDQGVDSMLISRWIFRNWDLGYGMDRAGS